MNIRQACVKNIWNPFIDLYTYIRNELTENEKINKNEHNILWK